jgi:hypothetical protein
VFWVALSWLVVWESKDVMTAGLSTAWDELSKEAEDLEVDDSVVACDRVIESSEDESSEVAFDWRARRCT